MGAKRTSTPALCDGLMIIGCRAYCNSSPNFTAVFGMVAIQALLVVAIAALLKDRKERERYRHIDEKRGARGAF